MALKSLDEIIDSYPFPPLSHPDNYTRFLRFVLADPFLTDPRFISYVLATCCHETQFTFAPVEEYSKGLGRPYGDPDPKTGKIYDGRGYVQLTWLENYKRFIAVTGFDLVNHPELAMEPAISYRIMSVGMREGMFTGRKLSEFVLPNGSFDFLSARKIINGMDCAEKIAEYAKKFYASIVPV